MKIELNKIILSLLLVLLLLYGCLEPDPPESYEEQLEIRMNGIPVRVIDIDPFTESDPPVMITVHDIQSGNILNTNIITRRHSSSTVQTFPFPDYYIIQGQKGGMGSITFTSGGKSAQLRVFVRNWGKNDVYRHTLYADTVNYPFDPNTAHNPSDSRAPNKLAAYQLIVDNGFHYEAPDGLSRRQPDATGTVVHRDIPRETIMRKIHDVPHIIQVPAINEPFLRKDVFAFHLHIDHDGDMVGGYDDRQRLELKTMDTGSVPGSTSDDFMYSTGGGDTFTYRWKFKLPADFRVSSEYTHIHQIKPEGGDSGNPTFTLTGRRLRTGQEVLQLIYRGPIRANGDPSVNWYPAQVNLAPFKGEWIYAETTITFDNPGAYRIKLVRIRDMKVLMEYIYSPEQYDEFDPFVMYRTGNSYIRPKFGIYRRIMHMTPFGLPNPDNPVLVYFGEERNERGEREMTVLYADFEMDKLRR